MDKFEFDLAIDSTDSIQSIVKSNSNLYTRENRAQLVPNVMVPKHSQSQWDKTVLSKLMGHSAYILMNVYDLINDSCLSAGSSRLDFVRK